MRLLAVGVDHRSAPAAVREALAFEGPRCAPGAGIAGATFPGNEFVILSTCNRVEIYTAGTLQTVPEAESLSDFLVEFHSIKPEIFTGHLVGYHDEGAVGHLFRVASSLESLVLGEGQILGQVREAYRAAVRAKDGRADLSHGLSNRPQGGQESPRADGHGPGQAFGRQRGRQPGSGGFRHLRRQDGARDWRRQDGAT